jgi:hypothetical protein
MNKYNIEGNIDFFAELYKSLDIIENDAKTEEDEHNCLISNQPLIANHVKMNCGHKFNYIPLYNDLVNHRDKFYSMESVSGRIHLNQIRCPYCRKKQEGVLPYYEEMGLTKVNGVNFFDTTIKTSNSYNKCEHNTENPLFDITKPESATNMPTILCGYYANQLMVIKSIIPELVIETGFYCHSHAKQIIKQNKLFSKQKDSNDKKQAKKDLIKEQKDDIMNIKLLKQKDKLVKLNDGVNLNKNVGENVILGPSIKSNGCVQILKSGLNKGTVCNCKIFMDGKCKRHYVIPK